MLGVTRILFWLCSMRACWPCPTGVGTSRYLIPTISSSKLWRRWRGRCPSLKDSRGIFMPSEPLVYIRGRLLPASQANISIFDYGIVLGATVTDLLRTFHQQPYRLQ